MVTLNHRDRSAISENLLELGRINDVGKKQSQQPSAMLDRDLLQLPGGHERQSTKVSRCNQWENGATGGTLAPHLAVSEQAS
jgi:hypothetical protein